MGRLGGAVALAMCAAAVAGCGAPERLSERDGAELLQAREGLDDAIDVEETLRTSREEARRIRREVQAIVSRGAFESEPLDEFGLAALGELRAIVPSVVEADSDDVPESLDREALKAFLRLATRDADRALLIPATDEVDRIERVVDSAEPGPDTEIPPRPRETRTLTVGRYLRAVERDLRPIWPALADRLRALRDAL